MNGADGTNWLNFIGLFFQCGTPLFLIALGWFVGSTVERRHLRSLRRREQLIMTIPLTDLKTQPPGINGKGGMLVSVPGTVHRAVLKYN